MGSISEEPGVYYKKISVDDGSQMWVDTAISSVYTDLFDGNSATANVQGGGDHQMYLSELTLPEPDEFGDSQLVGLKYLIHPTAVTLENLTSFPPEFKLWNLNKSMGNTEGTLTPSKRDLAVFTSRIDSGVPYLSDNFSGALAKTEVVRGKTILKGDEPFLTAANAAKYQHKRGMRGINMAKMTESEIANSGYARSFGGEDVVYIQKEWKIRHISSIYTGSFVDSLKNVYNEPSWQNIGGVLSGGKLEYMWVPVHGATWGWDIAWSDYEIQDVIQYTMEIEDSREVSVPVNADETIFTDIYSRGHGKRDADGNFLMEAQAAITSDKYLTGAQSLTLSTTWDELCATGQKQYNQISAPNYRNPGATNRQEVVAIMELPSPQPIDAVGSMTRESEDKFKPEGRDPSSDNYNCRGLTGQYFTMDFYIEELDFMYKAGSPHGGGDENDVGWFDNTACLRGMAVCFSLSKPLENETFYDFAQRTTALTEGLEAPEVPEYDWGSFFGFWIGRFKWDGSDTPSYNNLNQNFYSKDPIILCPSGFQGLQDEGSGGTDKTQYGWRTCNIGFHTSGSDPERFHETVGPSVFISPGTANDGVTFSDDDISGDCLELDDGVWNRLSVFFPPETDKDLAQLTVYDSKGNRKTQDIGLNPAIASYAQTGYYPKYISIWVVNYPGTRDIDPNNMNGETPQDKSHGDDAPPWTAKNTVHIDNVALHGFGSVIENASVNNNNISTRSNIKMGATSTYTSDIGSSTTWTGSGFDLVHGKGMTETVQNSTYISIGFDDPAEFDKRSGLVNGTYLLFNGMSTNSSGFEALHHTDAERYLRLGFTSNQKGEKLGQQNSHHFFEHNTGTHNRKLRGLSLTGASSKGFDLTGNTAVEKFNQKGLAKLNFQSNSHNRGLQYDDATICTSERRENIFASARLVGVEDAENGWVTVDNPAIFNLPDDQEYVIYRRDTRFDAISYFNTDWDTEPTNEHSLVVKIIERSGDSVRFNKDVRFTQKTHNRIADDSSIEAWALLVDSIFYTKNTLATQNGKSDVWISPLKYWLVLEVFNNSGVAGQPGVSRQFGSILAVNQGDASFPTSSVYGTTFNETKFTDTSISTNAWNLIPTSESETIETQIDYGYGIMSDENPEGGFVDRFLAKDADTKIIIDADSIISEGKYKSGDSVTTIVSPSNIINDTSITIGTSENGNTKNKPYALAKFKDELPTISNFEVTPDENNPYYPKFTWNCKDNDTWYGFIILDKTVPKHQYHNAFCHVPMNRPLPSTDNTTRLWPPNADTDTAFDIYDYVNNSHTTYGYYKNMINGTMTSANLTNNLIKDEYTFLSPEGLSGWCHNFNGNERLVVDMVGGNDKQTPQDGFSCSVIIRPSALPTDKATICSTADAAGFRIYLDEDGYIGVMAIFNRDTAQRGVVLTSHSTVSLDGTPTNIIVTFDKYLKHGNLKLFIDGKLEDVSGRAYIASDPGADNVDNWEWNKEIEEGFNNPDKLHIGGGYNFGNYEGRMEELVFYDEVIYPVVPRNGEFVLETPLEESDDNGKPINYFAKLFIKDYHNIRGKTPKDVATAPHLHLHKVGLGK